MPYLRAKGQDLFEQLGGSIEADLFSDEDDVDRYASVSSKFVSIIDSENMDLQLSPSDRRKAKLKDAFRTAWPYLNLSYELMLLGYNVAYIFAKTPFYRPWLQALRIDIRRASSDDLQAAASTAWPKKWRDWLPYALLESLRYVLPGSIFLFKLLEWWYSSASLRPSARMASSSTVLPPIKAPPSKPAVLSQEPQKGQCPVCEKQIVNATALNTSGWVCCYKCAWKYVSEWSKCPVTGIVTSTGDLRKIIG